MNIKTTNRISLDNLIVDSNVCVYFSKSIDSEFFSSLHKRLEELDHWVVPYKLNGSLNAKVQKIIKDSPNFFLSQVIGSNYNKILFNENAVRVSYNKADNIILTDENAYIFKISSMKNKTKNHFFRRLFDLGYSFNELFSFQPRLFGVYFEKGKKRTHLYVKEYDAYNMSDF